MDSCFTGMMWSISLTENVQSRNRLKQETQTMLYVWVQLSKWEYRLSIEEGQAHIAHNSLSYDTGQ